MTTLVLMLFAAYARPEILVETEWLAAHLRDSDIRIVDMRQSGYETAHIPGSVLLTNAAIRNINNPPTFTPTPSEFEALMRRTGISNDTRVIVLDERGGLYAARLWWMLNFYGHSNVALLNGGWVKWLKERRPMSHEIPEFRAGVRFMANPDFRWIATAAQVVDAIDKPGMRIVDARTAAEINGTDLRGIRRGGHIPSSIPVYWEDALNAQLKTFLPAEDLKRLYEERGVLPSDEVITYCQVGMRASHDLFVLYLLGYDKLRNYYGAWEEWGNRDDLPVALPKR